MPKKIKIKASLLILILTILFLGFLILILNSNLNLLSSYHQVYLSQKQNFVFSWIKEVLDYIGYHCFILPLIWIVSNLSAIIIFLSKANFLNLIIFRHKNHLFTNNNLFLWSFVGAFCFLILVIVFLLFKIMTSNYFQQKEILQNKLKKICLILFLTPLVPFLFYSINTMINVFLMSLKINDLKNNIALIIFNCSFLNQIHHFLKVPDDLNQFDYSNLSFLLCFFSLIVVAYCLFKIVLKLITICFELMWLLAFSFFIIFASLNQENNLLMKNHLNLSVQRWAMFVFFISSFLVFKSNFHFLIFFVFHSGLQGAKKTLLIFLLIIASSFLILEIPILINFLVSGNTLLNPYVHNSRLLSKLLIFKNIKNKLKNRFHHKQKLNKDLKAKNNQINTSTPIKKYVDLNVNKNFDFDYSATNFNNPGLNKNLSKYW